MNGIFVGTTVGNTRYLNEWFEGVSKLRPTKVLISIDDSRHDEVTTGLPLSIINYDTNLKWESYEKRHNKWVSDYSIGLGIKELLSKFVETDCSKALIVDSDIIVDEGLSKKIHRIDFDYLQIGVPAIPREGHLKLIDIFWQSSNFAINKRIAQQILPMMNFTLENSYPIDINIHKLIRSTKPNKHPKIKSPGLVHYLNKNGRTIRVSTLNAQLHSVYTKPLITARDYSRLIREKPHE